MTIPNKEETVPFVEATAPPEAYDVLAVVEESHHPNNHGDDTILPVAEQVPAYQEGEQHKQHFNRASNNLPQGTASPLLEDNKRHYWGRFQYPQVPTVLEASSKKATSGDVLPVYDSTSSGENPTTTTNLPSAIAQWDDREVRHAFLRKVYLILAAQMLLTFACCATMSLHKPTQTFVLQHGMPLYWISVVVLFAVICALGVYKREYPTNVILLGVFTLAMSYILGMVTAMYTAAGASDIILEALFLTATVFVVLTIFTLQSKWDFSFMGAGLGMCLWILVLWSFLSLIFGFQTGSVYALIGAVLFSGYIIFDTFMLAERLDPADYVVAAIELYLDIVNLFLMILRLLSSGSNR